MPEVNVASLAAQPYATLEGLRGACPVARAVGPDGAPFWLVTRYADVAAGLADPDLSLDRRNATPGQYHGLSLPPALDANLLNMDAPDHTRVRALAARAFTAQRVEALRPSIQQAADELIRGFAARGEADLVADYAAPLPILIISQILGVPAPDRSDFRLWTDAILAASADPAAAKAAMVQLTGFLGRLVADKRTSPGADLLSDLVQARDENGSLSEEELTSLAFLLLFAGYENSVHLIGSSILALLDHPDEMKRLLAQPELLEGAIEELARYDGPAPLAIRRFPTRDVEIGGTRIGAGETVMLSLAAANRDPARFPEPDRLDLQRSTGGHVALGRGAHYCLGAPLARLELQIAVDTVVRGLPGLRLSVPRDDVRFRPSIRTRGLTALPVAFDAGDGRQPQLQEGRQ
ncbi:cytochrome P450 family protein [Streptacidiphilus fuscans]|uniref:Cytochrome P450 n=1 Tax=Streptacidiphilus fuscans TaxID=2789292 RepID=A0A931FHR3_9ACTN|nr:cytochrome P450 [Streptacidiphilus fuscans]